MVGEWLNGLWRSKVPSSHRRFSALQQMGGTWKKTIRMMICPSWCGCGAIPCTPGECHPNKTFLRGNPPTQFLGWLVLVGYDPWPHVVHHDFPTSCLPSVPASWRSWIGTLPLWNPTQVFQYRKVPIYDPAICYGTLPLECPLLRPCHLRSADPRRRLHHLSHLRGVPSLKKPGGKNHGKIAKIIQSRKKWSLSKTTVWDDFARASNFKRVSGKWILRLYTGTPSFWDAWGYPSCMDTNMDLAWWDLQKGWMCKRGLQHITTPLNQLLEYPVFKAISRVQHDQLL